MIDLTTQRAPHPPYITVRPPPVLIVLVILMSLTACNSNGSTPEEVPSTRRSPQQVAPTDQVGQGGPTPPCAPPAAIIGEPKETEGIPLPDGAVYLQPAATPDDGIRIDAFVPLSVHEAYSFFLRRLERSRRFIVVSTDYEGFEAEVFFRAGEDEAGLVRVLVHCPSHSVISFERFPIG